MKRQRTALRHRLWATILILLMITVNSSVWAQTDIRIQIDGQPLETDVSPVIENDRVLVPVAHLLRALGAQVTWNEAARTVTISQNDRRMLLTIDSRTAQINGEAVQMEVPARILNQRTILPLRFVAENLEAVVEWDGVNRMVTVQTEETDFVHRPVDFEIVEDVSLSDSLSSWVEGNRMVQGIHSQMENDWMYVMAAGGQQPTGGFEMRVLTVVEIRPGEVFVEAEMEVPGIEEMVTQALTYPHQVIRFHAGEINSVTGRIRELQRGMQEVTLYFMNVTDTAFLTEGEPRLFQSKDVTAENVMAVLLAGPESSSLSRIIPREVTLLSASVNNGLASVDFSRHLAEVNLGAEAESVLVNSIVWTLVQLREVDRVQILVEGAIQETLAGHVAINQPLTR